MVETARLIVTVDSRQARQADTDLDQLGKTSSKVALAIKGLATAFGVRELHQATEAYATLTNRMRLVTDGAGELRAAQDAVFKSAQGAGQPLTATAELYQRIAANQKALSLSGKQVAGVTDTISKTLAISGTSAASAAAALTQLGQAFASGTLRGEELNSVMEQAPALSQAIAAGMGVSIGQLRSLGAEGKLTADAVIKALQAQAGAVDEQFGKIANTIGTAMQVVGNTFTRLVGELDQASGTTSSFANTVIGVSKSIDKLTADSSSLESTVKTVGAAMAGVGAAGAVLLTSKIYNTVTAYAAARAAAISQAQAVLVAAQAEQAQARAAMFLAQSEAFAARNSSASAFAAAAVTEARLREAAATASVVAAQAGLRTASAGVLSLLGGPAGLALLVGSLTASYFLFRDSADAATKALIDQNVTVGESIARYNELSAAQQRVQRLKWGEQQSEGLKLASGALDDYAYKVERAFSGTAFRDQFRFMIDEVKAGRKDLDSVTEWIEKGTNATPKFSKELADLASQYSANSKSAQDAKQKLEGVNSANNSTAESTKKLSAAQSEQASTTGAKADEWSKYIAKLKEARDLVGANAEAEAAYNAVRMGANAQQQAEAKLLGEQADILKRLQDAYKEGNKVEQESLKIKLAALFVAEDAAKKSAEKQTKAYQDIAKAAEDSAKRESAAAFMASAAKAYAPVMANPDQKNLKGYGLITNGATPPVKMAEQAESVADRVAKAWKQITDSTKPNKVTDKEANEAARILKAQKEALEGLLEKADINTRSTNAMADAYLNGANNVRALTIEQKIEEELLKTGADARPKVTKAINDEADARDRLAIGELVAQMRLENESTLDLAKATLQGESAVEAYNVAKQVQTALIGKNIAVGSKEYDQLVKLTKAQLDNNKAVERAGKANDIVDRLNPEIKLLREYREEQESLNEAMLRNPEKVGLYEDALRRLGDEYQANRQAATTWGQITIAAVDRIDDAFASMWKSVLDGSGNFMDTLKNSFRQFLAEMAHMAITKPIMVQIGSALGIGGLSGQSQGIFGGSGSGGGFNLESAWNTVSSAYSVGTSEFGSAALAGWKSGEGFLGGIQGAFKAGAGSLSASIGSLFGTSTSGTVVNGVYQLGSSAAPATVDLISNTVTNSATGAVTGTATGATTAATTGLAASSALMYGIGGAIQGYLKAGVKGAVAGAGGAVAGAYAGAAIGSAVPIIGNVIGAAIGAVLGGLFGSSLFGGDWITKDEGFQLGATGGELEAYSFEYQKKKGGLFSSNKKRTRLTAIDPEMQEALDKTYATTLGTVIGLFDSLDVELNDAVLDGLNVAATQISTRDKTAEEIQKEIADWFTLLADTAVGEVNKVTESGLEGFNFETLTKFVDNLYSANTSLKMIGVEMVDFNIAGGRAVENLVNLAGSIEALNENMTKFYSGFTTDAQKAVDTLEGVRGQFVAMGITLPATREAFAEAVKGLNVMSEAERQIFTSMTANAEQAAAAYTILEQRQSAYNSAFLSESENTAIAIQSLTDQIKAMGIELPGTRAEFRAMVEAAASDTSESGRKLYESLMNVAALAGQAFETLDSQASTAAQNLMGAADASFAALQRSINAQKGSINDSITAARTNASGLTSISSALGNALKALRGDSDEAVRTLRNQAKATIVSALAISKAGGSLSSFEGLEDALSVISDNDTGLYSSLEDFNREQGRNANLIAELNGLNGKQLSASEKTIKALEEQLVGLDKQLEFAQAQMDALNGVDNSVKTVADAIKEMNASVVAAIASITGKITPQNAGVLIDSIYKDQLGRPADDGGKAYWQGQLASGNLNAGNITGAITNAAAIEAAYKAAGIAMNDGAAYWATQLTTGALTPAQLQDAVRNAALANGQLPKYATGGLISGPGTGTSDSILARLSNGEYVMSADSVRMFGTGLLDQMNAGRLPGFATGGGVGETGPVLQITRPAQIYSQPQARGGQGGEAATVAELRGLRKETEENARYMGSKLKDMADLLDDIAGRGVQIVGTVETKAAMA